VEGQKNGSGDGIVGDIATCVEKILYPLFGNHDGLVSFDFGNCFRSERVKSNSLGYIMLS
jgi:hypothetical protein